MTSIYQDGTYLENNPTWHAEHSPWKAAQILRILAANSIRPDSVCEVGCGAGEVLIELSKEFPHAKFVGYEISETAYKLLKEKNSNVDFRFADFLSQDDYYDAVLAIDVFEHVEDYFGFLKKLRVKGKYKIFHIPLDISVQTVLRNRPIINVREQVGHLHYFTKYVALETLKDCGYEILDYFYTAGSIEMSGRNLKMRLAEFPRRIAYFLNKDLTVRILGGYSLLVLTT